MSQLIVGTFCVLALLATSTPRVAAEPDVTMRPEAPAPMREAIKVVIARHIAHLDQLILQQRASLNASWSPLERQSIAYELMQLQAKRRALAQLLLRLMEPQSPESTERIFARAGSPLAGRAYHRSDRV